MFILMILLRGLRGLNGEIKIYDNHDNTTSWLFAPL